ncbi:hypothetical protein ACJJIX_00510 [Microbulbifer sp. VAAC004]|uniref:hypothetical protein n=1 Tax=unclassified Microbulbifer TaxID=2619833 RepID=UPI0040392964
MSGRFFGGLSNLFYGGITLLFSLLVNLAKPFRENWPEKLHYLFLSAAIAVGGWWALYTYKAFEQKERALKDLENVKKELLQKEAEITKKKAEVQEIEKRLEGNFSSDITIDSNVVFLNDRKYGLIVDVTIKNVGTKDVILNFDNNPLTVSKLNFDGDRVVAEKTYNPQYYKSISDSPKEISSKVFPAQAILIGASKKVTFFTEVFDPGIYYITFEANMAGEQKLRHENNNYLWFASKYIQVEAACCENGYKFAEKSKLINRN